MNIDFKKIGKWISENRGMILYAVGTIATAIVGSKYGISTTTSTSGVIDPFPKASDLGVALNSKQMAISSLTKTALNGGWSSKDAALRQIFDIAKADPSDYTRAYAIKALQKIADAGGWSAKDDAQKFITLLAKMPIGETT